MERRKKLFVIGGIVLAVAAAAILLIALRSDKQSGTQNEEPDQSVAEDQSYGLGGINLRNVSEIEAIEDPSERFSTYMLTAGDAEYQGMLKEALGYYRAAADVDGVDEAWKKNNLLRAYYMAKDVNDKESEEFFAGVIGQEIIDENESVQEELKKMDGNQ